MIFGNSFLGAFCIDLANFGRSQTISLASHPKFAKNSTTSTAITRIVWGINAQFRTCKNFWDFADAQSSLNPKNFYKHKSHTANTSIVAIAASMRFWQSKFNKKERAC